MKVIYESAGGNTRKLALKIAETLKVEAWDLGADVDVRKIDDGELIFLGSGAYGFTCGNNAKLFIKELAQKKKKVRIALFGTSFMKNFAVKALRKQCDKYDLKPLGDDYNAPGKFKIFHTKRPNESDLNGAVNFATRLTKK